MNEFSTALPYLLLFASKPLSATPEIPETIAVEEKSSPTVPPSSSSSPRPECTAQTSSASTRPTFWHEDKWTEEDIKVVQDSILNVNGYVSDDHDDDGGDDDDDGDDHDSTPFSEEYIQRQRMRYNLPLNSTDLRNDNMNKHAQDAWNSFYQRHQVGFFRDRHYLPKEFPNEFQSSPTATITCKTWMEMGCGVGNAVLPFLEESSVHMVQGWTIHAIDLSAVAIDLLQQDERWIQTLERRKQYESNMASSISLTPPLVCAHVCDVSCQPLRLDQREAFGVHVTPCADIMTLLFCLSAVATDRMEYAIRNMTQYLKVGGILLFRDYGRYDQAQLQLAKQQQQQLPKFNTKRARQKQTQATASAPPTTEHEKNDCSLKNEGVGTHGQRDELLVLDSESYVKQDGTSCYYFTLEEIQHMFRHYGGCQVLQLQYLQRVYTNRATNQPRRRVWIQGRFMKTI